jgi:L-tyrosine reductase
LMKASPGCLLPLQPMLTEKVLDGKTRWELYENMPTYETTNTEEALADYPGGLEVLVIDPLLITKYLAFLNGSKGCS